MNANRSQISMLLRWGILAISMLIVGDLACEWGKSLIRTAICWRLFFESIPILLFGSPFGMIIYFYFGKKFNKMFEVVIFLISLIIFFMAVTVFQRADLVHTLIDWRHTGFQGSFGMLFLTILPIAAPIILAQFIFKSLSKYAEKYLQQDGTLNNPQRGSFRGSKL